MDLSDGPSAALATELVPENCSLIRIWSYGVTVSTLDSESSDRGSNPRRTLCANATAHGNLDVMPRHGSSIPRASISTSRCVVAVPRSLCRLRSYNDSSSAICLSPLAQGHFGRAVKASAC